MKRRLTKGVRAAIFTVVTGALASRPGENEFATALRHFSHTLPHHPHTLHAAHSPGVGSSRNTTLGFDTTSITPLPHLRHASYTFQRSPDVGSSMNTTLGFDTSSTPMVKRLRCSTLRPFTPAVPTRLYMMSIMSMMSSTSLT